MSAAPNFILFITDQHRADHLGCYGHPVLRTPHIDSIAARGVAMDRFYVASPVCMPNRASLMTGRMPSSHGARANGIPLSRDAVTFVDLLAAAGYRTALVGKSHLQNFTDGKPMFVPAEPRAGLRVPPAHLVRAVPHDLTGPRYKEESPGAWRGGKRSIEVPFYGFDHVDLVTGHGDRCGGDYFHWLNERHPEAEKLRAVESALKHDYICPQAVRTALPESLYPTSYIREHAVDYLNSTPKDQPFFLMVSFPDPHHPFTPPGHYWDMYRPEDMPCPPAYSRKDWRPSPFSQRHLDARANGKARVEGYGAFAISEREALEARALTCGSISMIDDAIGEVLKSLDATGRREETVLIFMSDHGDYLGDHQLLLKGAAMYQGIVRTPFIYSDPQGAIANKHVSGIASTIDVAPTLLERAGLAPYQGMEGVSQLATLSGGEAKRDAALIQFDSQAGHGAPGRMPRVHTLVTDDWRISIAEGARGGELFDLKKDPDEFFNRWNDGAVLSERCEMLDRLARAQMHAMDELPLPTGSS